MASLVKAGTITAPNATGSVANTDPGFPPDLLLAATTLDTTTTGSTPARITFGAAKSSSSRASVSAYTRHGSANAETSHITHTSYFLTSNTGGGSDAESAIADFVSSDTSGVTLTWPSNRNGALVNYLALKGIRSAIGSFNLNTSTGNQTVTGLTHNGIAFTPKLLILCTSVPDTTTNTGTSQAYFSYGAAVSSSKRFSYAFRDRDAIGTSDNARTFSDSFVYTEISTSAVQAQADFVSFGSGQFTINVTTAPATARSIVYIAIGGSNLQADVGRKASKTSTGTQAYTGVGFKPNALITVCEEATSASLDVIAANLGFVLGFATSSSQRGYVGYWADDNAPTMLAGRRTKSDKCVAGIDNNGTINVEADFTSFDSDGFTLDWTTASATAREFHYIALRITDLLLTTPPGSFTLTGQSLTMLGAHKLALGQASFTLTGQDLGFVYGASANTYELAIGRASFTLTGQNLSFQAEQHSESTPGGSLGGGGASNFAGGLLGTEDDFELMVRAYWDRYERDKKDRISLAELRKKLRRRERRRRRR